MTNHSCTVAEALIYQLALTINDGDLVFHGYGSPLVQIALHLAKRTHAPNMILVAGATYGVNPNPPFLTPTSNDWAMSADAECFFNIEELFDLAASGRMDRMFLSGLQIDRYGNLNVNQVHSLKLPGGGGGCNLSCDAKRLTLWTAAHRTELDAKGNRRYRLVKQCDFITSVGHKTVDGKPRSAIPYQGNGADRLITELAVFDFDEQGQARLIQLYPDTTVDMIKEHTEFDFVVSETLSIVPLPDAEMLEFMREFDPLGVHRREFRISELQRCFAY
jgi:glutaconate CoA-transferase subunit B